MVKFKLYLYAVVSVIFYIADAIQDIVKETYDSTQCPCQECAANNQGYVIMVAIMPRMYRIVKWAICTHTLQ